jgi:hypothetical protein
MSRSGSPTKRTPMLERRGTEVTAWRFLPALAKEEGEKRGKAKYRLVQALKAVVRLAAAVAHPERLAGWLAGRQGTSCIQRVTGDPQAWALEHARGARRWELSQLPCGPLSTLFLLITPGIQEPDEWEEEEGGAAALDPGAGGREATGRREGHFALVSSGRGEAIATNSGACPSAIFLGAQPAWGPALPACGCARAPRTRA